MDLTARVDSFRFGAGRYFQEENLLTRSGDEIKKYGRSVYVIAGPQALAACGSSFKESLDKAGLTATVEVYDGYPSRTKIKALTDQIREQGIEVLAGVGGGRILDLVKAAACMAEIPMVMIPTSAATCACFTPVSVLYTDEGAHDCCWRFDREVDLVLVDERVMVEQPPRLLAAGILDALAKYFEITNGRPALTPKDDAIELYAAYHMAEMTYRLLIENGPKAYADLTARRWTKTLRDVIFVNLALTGLISNMTRGYNQTAIAHKLYESMRTCYFEECRPYYHGEIVGAGLISQLKFNHNEAGIDELKAYMTVMNAPMTLTALGLKGSDDEIETLTERIYQTRFVKKTEEQKALLRESLRLLLPDDGAAV